MDGEKGMNSDDERGKAVAGFADWLGIDDEVDRRRFFSRLGKGMLVLSATGTLPAILSACGNSSTGSGKRVAFIIFVNNPYWQETKAQVEKLLKPRLARQGVTVDLVNAAASASAVGLSEAIESALSQEYDGIIVAGVASSMTPAIDRAVSEGVPVFTFCCDVTNSERLAFYGPDNRQIGRDAAKLMAQGIEEKDLLTKRGLDKGTVGIETTLGIESLLERAEGFKEEWEKVGPENVSLLPFIQIKEEEAEVIYSQSMSTISAQPDLVGLYLSTGTQYALGEAIIASGKTEDLIGIAHEVFEPTLKVMLKSGIWAVTNDAPIGQVIPPGDAMSALLRKGTKPKKLNYSNENVRHYLVYANDKAFIKQELNRWNELLHGCENGCDDLVKAELK